MITSLYLCDLLDDTDHRCALEFDHPGHCEPVAAILSRHPSSTVITLPNVAAAKRAEQVAALAFAASVLQRACDDGDGQAGYGARVLRAAIERVQHGCSAFPPAARDTAVDARIYPRAQTIKEAIDSIEAQ